MPNIDHFSDVISAVAGARASGLKIADGAVVLDTSHHSIESAVDAAIEILKQQGLPESETLPSSP